MSRAVSLLWLYRSGDSLSAVVASTAQHEEALLYLPAMVEHADGRPAAGAVDVV